MLNGVTLAELVNELLFVIVVRKTFHFPYQWFYLLIDGILLRISTGCMLLKATAVFVVFIRPSFTASSN
jgi:hypothetical protein